MSDIKKPAGELVDEIESIKQPASKKKGGWGTKILVIIIVIVVILIGLYLVSKYTDWNVLNVNKTSSTVKTTGWQAIFLSNGQVYFGRIASQDKDKLVLKEIYYLQVTQQIQPAPEGQEPQTAQNLSLVKLGNELHGPKDIMQINMAHVLFTEELKEGSSVVNAIKDYLEAPVE